jgi:predicted nucleic acid-binding protein
MIHAPVRVMFDTNVIISAILNNRSTPAAALLKAARAPLLSSVSEQMRL